MTDYELQMTRIKKLEVQPGIEIGYEELGTGDKYVLCTQMGFNEQFYARKFADHGYHVFLLWNRGSGPSSPATEDFGPGCTGIRFLFESEPHVEVICQLLLPKKAPDEKLPLVICLQGHSKGMHLSLGRAVYEGDEEKIAGGDRDFARQIAERGQAALAIEQRAFGERGGTPEGPACLHPALQALLLGHTLIGERCWDVSRAIDAVKAHFPMIDTDRIAVMGNSGGGTVALYAAALDTRISAAMPSCAVSSFISSIGVRRHCACNYVPGIAREFDMGDIAGLIAPRPLIVVSGENDGLFPVEGAKEQVRIARASYEAAGAPGRIAHVIGPEGHRFYAALSWPVFDALTGWRSAGA